MSGPSAPGAWPSSAGDDGWGPATAVRAGSQRGRAPQDAGRASPPPRQDDGWSRGGPASAEQQRRNRATERSVQRLQDRASRRERDRWTEDERAAARAEARAAAANERGLRAWAALLVLVVIAGIGGIVDTVGSIDIQGGFNIGIVIASIVAIIVVKRSHMFPVVIAPPIVYTLGAGFQYYLRASSGGGTKAKIDAAANYLVYGFPAIAAASAAVLLIAGFRLIARR